MNSVEIKEIRKSLGLNQTEFGKIFGVTLRTVQNWESGNRNMSESAYKLLMTKLEREQSSQTNEPTESYLVKSKEGVPYYDIDFTASFLEVENNYKSQPDSYVTHPFFTGCDYIVRASGQSMAKIIKHGDAIGLIKIENWREFIPMGEIYAIVTDNGFRMIKIITKGEDSEHFTLISKPSDNKKGEFPPQQINKSNILHLFKVQASSHLF